MPTSVSKAGPPRPGGGRPVDRLLRSADYQRVQGSGRRIRSKNLLLLYTPGVGARTRVGWAVSRKVGNAVERNRIKRWFREGLRGIDPPIGAWDVVLIPRREVLDAGYVVLSRELADIFRRVHA